MSLTHSERLRRRAYETKGGDSLLLAAANELDRMQRVIDELRSDVAITVAEHVEQSPWMGPTFGLPTQPRRQHGTSR